MSAETGDHPTQSWFPAHVANGSSMTPGAAGGQLVQGAGFQQLCQPLALFDGAVRNAVVRLDAVKILILLENVTKGPAPTQRPAVIGTTAGDVQPFPMPVDEPGLAGGRTRRTVTRTRRAVEAEENDPGSNDGGKEDEYVKTGSNMVGQLPTAGISGWNRKLVSSLPSAVPRIKLSCDQVTVPGGGNVRVLWRCKGQLKAEVVHLNLTLQRRLLTGVVGHYVVHLVGGILKAEGGLPGSVWTRDRLYMRSGLSAKSWSPQATLFGYP
ncbi:hypothetical protein B0H14DRAFT_3158192 [Mycena olivaceomarginata]|nr:hypothetical protein B0H14DRAFT_3158192 [Mycena olivaceomarginata]